MGVLIAVKDNIHVSGFPNSAGTPALAQFRPKTSAPIIQKLVDHGAIIVGKAHMHELAFGVTGYNSAMHVDGVIGTRNAKNPRHIAGGSSSGSAVAVAAGMVPIAIGTDTGASGSITLCFKWMCRIPSNNRTIFSSWNYTYLTYA